MLTLTQAIAALIKATDFTKNKRQQFRVGGGRISTTNGTVSAIAPFGADFPDTPLVVDVEPLRRVWTDTARASIKDNILVVRDRKSTYKLRIVDDLMSLPKIEEGGEQMTVKARDAILRAAKFASAASPDAWLCGVSIRNRRVVGTNRVAAISVDCDLDTDAVLPAWAIKALRSDGAPPQIAAGRLGVTLTYPDGLLVHSAPLASLPPDRLFELVSHEPIEMIDIKPLLDAKDDALRLEGKSVRLDPGAGTVTVNVEDGDATVTEVDLGGVGAAIQLQENVFQLLVAHATHATFERAPDRLLFRVDAGGETIARGLIAGMVQ